MSDKVKRILRFHGLDTDMNISKVVEVDVDKKFFYIEETKDGSFRLTYTKCLFEKELKNLDNIEMIREN